MYQFSSPEHNDIIEFIKSKMKDKSVTQKELADYAGVKDVSMHRYLNYERTMPYRVMSKCLERFNYVFTYYDLTRGVIEMKSKGDLYDEI